MFDVIKSAISAGGYKLADMQYKIKKLYVLGDLTEAEMDELLALENYIPADRLGDQAKLTGGGESNE